MRPDRTRLWLIVFLLGLISSSVRAQEPEVGPSFDEALVAIAAKPRLLLDSDYRKPLRFLQYEQERKLESVVTKIIADPEQSFAVRATALSFLRFGGKRNLSFRRVREALHYGEPRPSEKEILKGLELLARSQFRNEYWQGWFLKLLKPYGKSSGFLENYGSRCTVALVDRVLEPTPEIRPVPSRRAIDVLLASDAEKVRHLAKRWVCAHAGPDDADRLVALASEDWIFPAFPSIAYAVDYLPRRPLTSTSDSKEKNDLRALGAFATFGASEMFIAGAEGPDYSYDTKYQAIERLRYGSKIALDAKQLAQLEASMPAWKIGEDISVTAFRYHHLQLLLRLGQQGEKAIPTFVEQVVKMAAAEKDEAHTRLSLALDLVTAVDEKNASAGLEHVSKKARLSLWQQVSRDPRADRLMALNRTLPLGEGRQDVETKLLAAIPTMAGLVLSGADRVDWGEAIGLDYPYPFQSQAFRIESMGVPDLPGSIVGAWVKKLHALGLVGKARAGISAASELEEDARAALLARLES